MLSLKSFGLIITNYIVIIKCGTLPSYIDPCALSDPDLNNCIKEHAISAIPNIIKGDKERKIPPLSPYRISKIEIEAGNNLKISFTDATITGLDLLTVLDTNIDLKEKVFKIKVRLQKATLTGNYKMDGRILILPISGEGKGTISLENVVCHYALNYDTVKKDDGKAYFHIVEAHLEKLDTEKTHYEFENLFNGDKTLSHEIHKLLNENPEDINKEVKPGSIKIVEAIALKIIKAYVEDVLFDDIFKP